MTESTSSLVPIVLCCAEDSEVFLAPLVETLNKEGMAPQVVAGVDVDPMSMGELADRTQGAALFVLCQGGGLDKVVARRLNGLFSARKGPLQRMIIVQLAEARPLSMLPNIRTGLRDVLRARAHKDEPHEDTTDGDRVNLREVVKPMPFSAARVAPTREFPRDDQLPDLDGIEDAESLAKELHGEMLAAEAILSRRDGTRAHRRSRHNPEPEPRGTVPVEEDGRFVDDSEPGAPMSELDARSLAPVVVEAPREIDPAAETIQTGRRSEITEPEASTARSARPNVVRWTIATAGVTALVLVAIFASGDRRDVSAQDEEAITRGKKTDTQEVFTPAVPSAPSAPSEHESPDEHEAHEATQSVIRTARPAPPPPSMDDEALAIGEALTQGRMRALDAMLVLPPTDDTITWEDARAHCRRQRVAGVGDWRLPSKAEVHRLRRARLVPIHSYWTRHKGEVEDEAIAYDQRTGTWVAWLTIEANARAFCVRER